MMTEFDGVLESGRIFDDEGLLDEVEREMGLIPGDDRTPSRRAGTGAEGDGGAAELMQLSTGALPGPSKGALRDIVRTLYDYQASRIAQGNRICANFRWLLGLNPGDTIDLMDKKAKELIETMRLEYTRMADALARNDRRRWEKFIDENRRTEGSLIRSKEHLVMARQYILAEDREQELADQIKTLVQDYPLWEYFLKDIRGLGPIIAAIIISEMDPYKSRYPSSMFAYAGLDVVFNPETRMGEGRSRKQAHQVERAYTGRDGQEHTRRGITFNPTLKTKLVGVLLGSWLKAHQPDKGFTSYYAQVYYDYRTRLELRQDWEQDPQAERLLVPVSLKAAELGFAEATRMRRHRMAARYAVKIFLKHLYEVWRTLEGLPVEPDYQQRMLGHTHHAPRPDFVQHALDRINETRRELARTGGLVMPGDRDTASEQLTAAGSLLDMHGPETALTPELAASIINQRAG